MGLGLAEFAEKLVSISEFSQGKAGKIFADVAENNHEYIVLKNNQPIAVVMSVKEYRELQEQVAQYEKLMERIANIRLLKQAENNSYANNSTFQDIMEEGRLTEEELEALAGCMDFE